MSFLPFFTDRFNIIMYADDTTLYGNREDFASFETNVNSNLEILNNWFKINKLSLNPEKTKLMMFRKKKQINPVVINFNNVQITEVSFFNFLGIVFNNKLTWTNHVSMIAGKISKIIYILKRFKSIYPLHILKIIYCSLVQSKLLYGLLLWGVDLKNISVLQKKAIRIINGSNFYSHTEPLFKKL